MIYIISCFTIVKQEKNHYLTLKDHNEYNAYKLH